MLSVALVVLPLILQSLRQGFLQGFQAAVLAGIIVVTVSTVLLGGFDAAVVVGIALFSLLLGATALLSLLTGSLSVALILILLDRPKKATEIHVFLTIIVAIVVSGFLMLSLQPRALFPNELSLRILSGVTGLLFGGGAILVSKFATASTAPKQFEFLRMWAISIGCWRGTSFYDLDLSGVNFRNAKLANTDLRARTLYRTCFQGADGLERAKVDRRYLDLDDWKVQQLLTCGGSSEHNFRRCNLQGAYLQNANLREIDFTDTNLTGGDLKRADLRESILVRTQSANIDCNETDLRKAILIDANLTEASFRQADLRGCLLVRAQVARADFTEADLTGVCIEDWSVSSKTRFTGVRCDYIYRKYESGQLLDRYPVDRNFEPGEFASLFAEPEDEVELVFKGDFNIAALSLALYKLQTDASELNLELRGVEQRENLWVAKIKSTSSSLNERLIQERLTSIYQDPLSNRTTVETTIKSSIYRDYEETKRRLAESEHLVRELAGISGSQAEALKELSKRSFGNNFFISGSTITNLAGSGQIEYREAASSIRSLVTNRLDPHITLQQLIGQFNAQNVATTSTTQRELIQQVLLSEANQDPTFRQFLIEQEQQIINSVPSRDIAIAVQAAIAQLKSST